MQPDLSIRLGSLELKNPVVCASGEWVTTAEALRSAIDAGAAAVVAKSTNESEAAKLQLASAESALLDSEWRQSANGRSASTVSLFNRSGLVDCSFDEWVERLVEADAYARGQDSFVVASLIPAKLEALPRMARAFEEAGLRWLELNVGAAHGEEVQAGAIELAYDAGRVSEIVSRVRAAVSLHLTVKLPGQGDVLGMAAAAHEAGADSLCLAGRPLAFLPDLDTRRPILGTFGAIGGGWALPLTLRWVAKARLRLGPGVPLIATNGLRSGDDVARALLAGASAAQLGTMVWAEGSGALTRTLEELEPYLATQGVSAQDLVGEAADAVMTYEEAARRRGE